MANFLEAARIVIEKWGRAMVGNPENLFLLNEAQCTHLWRNLRRVYDALAPSFSFPPDVQQRCLHVFIDFYIVVLHGDRVMEMCSSRKWWLKAALFYGDNQRMFQELSVDLNSCAESAHKLTKSLFRDSLDPKPLAFVDDVVIHDDQADVDFRRDASRLRSRLEEHVKLPDLEEEEKNLASYLIERDIYRSSTHGHDLDSQDIPGFFETDRQYPMEGRNIARGGLDGVHVVKVTWLGLECAKKEFLRARSKENFMNEVNALVRLNHPNVVKLLCSRSVMPDPSFLMELVDMSLSDFIEERKRDNSRIKMEAAVDLMLQMGLGMEYLHGEGVVHRDLKSPNILVYPSPDPELRKMGYAHVKVTDFGLAKVEVFDPMVPTWKMRGTPHWIAPEAIDPKGRIDWRKADTYSFAITCLEILKCEVGPRSGSLDELGESECPMKYLREFLQKCGDREHPSKRPSFEEIVRTLRAFKKHLVLGTTPKQVLQQAPMIAVSRGKRNWTSTKKIRDFLSLRILCRKDLDAAPSLEVSPSLEVFADPAEKEQYKSAIAGIRSGLESIASVCNILKAHLKQVQVCSNQCRHLVLEYSDGVAKVKSTFDHLSPTDLLNLLRSKKLRNLRRSLQLLGSSILSAIELLEECCSQTRKFSCPAISTLALSAPVPSRRMYSKFGRCLRKLYWNLYAIHHALDGVRSDQVLGVQLLHSDASSLWFDWCKERCRLTLRRNSTGSKDAEDEFLEADAKRQDQDRHSLRNVLESSVRRSAGPPSRSSAVVADYGAGFADFLRKRLKSTWDAEDESGLGFASEQDCWFVPDENIEVSNQVRSFDPGIPRWLGIPRRLYMGFLFEASIFILGHLDPGAFPDGESSSQFRTEKEVLARVQHPNVVQFIGYAHRYSYSKDQGAYARDDLSFSIFIEPYNSTLYYSVRRNLNLFSGSPFSLRVTVDILLQIVEGMIHVHECGVIHRDLNPHTVLQFGRDIWLCSSKDFPIDDFYTLKLGGFHSAVASELKRPLNSGDKFYLHHPSYLGTYPYVAPELWESVETNEGYTCSVDIWSFGMTAYYIVTGSSRFSDFIHFSTDEVGRARCKHGRFSDWEYEFDSAYRRPIFEDVIFDNFGNDCPEHLRKVITGCCAREPEARPSFEMIRKELWTLKRDLDIGILESDVSSRWRDLDIGILELDVSSRWRDLNL